MAENLLLAAMPESERRRITPYGETVPLVHRATLLHPESPIDYVWFPHSGVCSSLVQVDTGEAVEVGLVGREGMIGLPLVLGATATSFQVIVQAEGSATRIARDRFVRDVLQSGYPLCEALLKYADLFLSNVAQTAACNRLHRIEQRLARWLLEMNLRVEGSTLPVTHDLLALMVGAYRPSVTNAVNTLENRGLIRPGRGKITILDAASLARDSCGCFAAAAARTARTMESIERIAGA